MKLGIIGAGMIVQDVLSFIDQIKEIEITAICATARSKEKLEAICSKHNIPNYYLSVDELINDMNVDTVYVATPNHLHYEYSKLALLNNKDVLCEKPFTTTLEEAEELFSLAKQNNRIILEAITTPYLPAMIELKKMISKIGNIKIVSTNFSQYSSRYDAFKEGTVLPAFNPEMAGGALMDLNIYNIHFMTELFGKPKTVDYQANIERGIDTSGIVTLDYNDFKAICIGAKDCKAPVLSTIQGDKGCIKIETSVSLMTEFTLLLNDDIEEHTYTDHQDRHRMYHEFVAFVKMLENRDMDKVEKMARNTLIAMEIQNRARESAGIIFPADKNS